MHFKSQTIVLIVSVLFLAFIVPTYSFGGNYDRAYTFSVESGGSRRFSHTLYTSVPPSLYDYYCGRSHRVYRNRDYLKFVTPNAVKPIAESIRNVTRDVPYSDEQFANAVLMLVHQIPYVKSNVKYPVEAIVDNTGDCDVLSLLAASIMKAGGLDIVLLYYKDRSPSHMNVGVYLPYTPIYQTEWMASTYYEYNDKKYWMAECTSQGDWKVGDQPISLTGARASIISLEDCEETSPAHVSSSLDSPLLASSISINLSPGPSIVGERALALTIYSGQRVVTYVTQDGSSSNTFGTVYTDDLGNYSLTWNFTLPGTYCIRTSWSGDSNHTGSDSEKLTVFVRLSQPLVEFEEPEDYWGAEPDFVSARASFAVLNFIRHTDFKEFLEINCSGAEGVFLSGEFIVLRSEQNITTLVNERTIRIRIPRSEQRINDQFGLVLRHNDGNNYSVSIRGLDDYGIPQITKGLDGNNTAFMNASLSTKENTWYKVLAEMSENEITAELYDNNGTLLQSIATGDDTTSISELGILIAYDRDTVVAFKNLKVETINQPTPPVDDTNIPVYTDTSAYNIEWRRGG
jgi:hypothetical protein